MHRFSNILFSPLGESDNAAAVRRLVQLADLNDAQLTLFGVVPRPAGLQRVLHSPEHFRQIQEVDQRAMSQRLGQWAAKSRDGKIDIDVKTGSRGLEIIERVVTAGHDLVVVTTDEDRQDEATIRRLMRKCPCPVWVIRPSRARVPRVLAAVNPEPEEAELNRTILELSASMVEVFGGELHLVHAWQLYGEAALRSSAFVRTTEAEVEALLTQERDSRAEAISDLLEETGLEDAPWKIHLEKGPAEEIVADVVARYRIELLVMGTVARTGIPGVLIGNTAENVLDGLRCSVIAVKPPGFTSPLHLGSG